MFKYLKSARMSAQVKLGGGMLGLLPDILIKSCTLIALMSLWRVVMSSGVEVGLTTRQMLSYAYMSALLTDLLVVKTAATGWLSEGVLLQLYGRPLSVLGQLAAQTVGGWAPSLIFFSLPMALLSPLLGVELLPVSLWFLPSLFFCVSLGFALEILFACLSIRLRNMSWLIDRIRAAIISLLSGTVIPLSLLPFGIGEALRYQPFACLGGAPLSVFVGSAEPLTILRLQLFWNAVLWPAALLAYKNSQERIVSYGG